MLTELTYTNICWSGIRHNAKAAPMDANGFRALANRCRELARVAVRDDLRCQFREWIGDFEAEAEIADKAERRRAGRAGGF